MGKREQIVDDLAGQIEDRRLAEGARLPSEDALRRQYGVSRLTARSALTELEAQGLIASRKGAGWSVRPDSRRSFELLTFDKGHEAGPVDVWKSWLNAAGLVGDAELSVRAAVTPPSHVVEHLELEADQLVVERRRLRRVIDRDGGQWEPVMVSAAYFPSWLADDTPLAAPEDMQSPSPMAWVAVKYGPMTDDFDRIGARMPRRAEIDLLALDPGVPVLTRCRTTRDRHGRCVRCTADVMAANRFYLTVHQHHREPE